MLKVKVNISSSSLLSFSKKADDSVSWGATTGQHADKEEARGEAERKN